MSTLMAVVWTFPKKGNPTEQKEKNASTHFRTDGNFPKNLQTKMSHTIHLNKTQELNYLKGI